MVISRASRLLPGAHALLRTHLLHATQPVIYVRGMSRLPWVGQGDPFRQMDAFMHDMERKLRHTINAAFGVRPFDWSDSWRTPVSVSYQDPLSAAVDVSSDGTFKLLFNCSGAKHEDVSVTLKDRLLTVKVQVVTESENSKAVRHLEHQQTLPEGVDGSKLESSLSASGELTVWAPRDPPEGPQTIKVHRE